MHRRSFSLVASALTHTYHPRISRTAPFPLISIAMASTRATRSFLKAVDSKEAASETAAAPSSAAAALFTPLRAPAARSQRKRGAAAAAGVDADAAEAEAGAADVVEEQVSQEQEEAEEAAAEEQASVSAADAEQGPSRVKRQKLAEESKATIPDAPPAAAAAASSASAAPGAVARTSPDVLSFPASLLNEPVSSYAAAFDAIARNMLLDLELHSNGHVMRVLEMEIYYKGVPNPAVKDGGHVDLFAHAHPVQAANYGNWYWHRQGQKVDASYKGGNYKGLDVTCGPLGASDLGVEVAGHGGILIRSVQRVSDGVCIEGSCLVAEEVLRQHGASSIAEVVGKWKGNTSAFTNPTLFFAPATHKLPSPGAGKPVIVRSPRVGLTLKQKGESRPRYLMLPYRYTRTDVPGFCNKKMKQTVLCSAYAELGGSASAKEYLRTLCGCNAAFVDMHIAAFESGKKAASMDKYVSSASAAPPNAQGMSAMYGAWMACFGDKNHVAFLRA